MTATVSPALRPRPAFAAPLGVGAIALAALTALAGAAPAQAALSGTLYPGLAFDIVTGPDGILRYAGYVAPTVPAVGPDSELAVVPRPARPASARRSSTRATPPSTWATAAWS